MGKSQTPEGSVAQCLLETPVGNKTMENKALQYRHRARRVIRRASLTCIFIVMVFCGGCSSRPFGGSAGVDGGLGDAHWGDGSTDSYPDPPDSGEIDGSIDGRVPSSCGNGVAEPGEECDGDELRGETCEGLTGHLEGDLGCTETCVYDTGPCHTCGDGVASGNEQCDGNDFGGQTCLDFTGHTQGSLTCFADCTVDTSLCHTCGDGVRESSEVCDGDELGGASCETLGFIQGGELSCGSGCEYETSGCCGDGVMGADEECDGGDFGGLSCPLLGFYQGGSLTCTPGCFIDSTSCCGDGNVGPGEGCDDQNLTDWDGCNDCEIVEFRMNETTQGHQGIADIDKSSNSEWIVVWSSEGQDGDGIGIFARKFDATGEPIGGEFQVNTYTEGDQMGPEVAAWSDGGFVVVWYSEDQDGDSMGVYAQRFDADMQAVGEENQVNDYTAGLQMHPTVATLSGGRSIVVWASEGQDGHSMGVFGKIYDGVTPVTGDLLINTQTASGQTMPNVAVGPNDEVVVVWKSYDQDGDGSGIFGQLLDSNGVKVGNEFQVNTYTQNYQMDPKVAASSNGFAVIWKRNSQGSFTPSIWARTFNWTGTPTTGEFSVDVAGVDTRCCPSIGLDDQGTIFASWDVRDKDGDGWGVYARRFDASGSPLGPEFLVNQFTTDGQGASNIKLLPSGEAFVVWTSFSQDGSGAGVYGQRYDANGNPLGHMPYP